MDAIQEQESPADSPLGLSARVDAFERQLIEAELEKSGGQVVRAAEALGVPKKTLYDKLARYAIDPEVYRRRR